MSPSAFDTMTELLWNQLWQVTLVALAIGLIVRVFCRHRAHLAYLLWMLVLVKCLTPPLVAHPISLVAWPVNSAPTETMAAVNRIVDDSPIVAQNSETNAPRDVTAGMLGGPISPTDEAASEPAAVPARGLMRTLSPSRLLVGAWLLGVAMLLMVLAVKWLRFQHQLRRSTLPTSAALDQLLNDVQARLGLRWRVRLLVTSLPTMPAVFGVVRPTIILPGDLVQKLSSDALEPILVHELLHIRRLDTIAGQFQLATRILWWFHPLVWWVNREASRARERCCDQQVVATLGCRPADYARCLLHVLSLRVEWRPGLAALAIEPAELTAKRLTAIMRPAHGPRSSKSHWLLAAAMAAIVLPGGAFSHSYGGTQAEGLAENTTADQAGLNQHISDSELATEGRTKLTGNKNSTTYVSKEDRGPSDTINEEEGPGAAGLSVRNVPPVVVKTFPAAGDKNVPPTTDKITVTFSKHMRDQNWSWVQISDESFPEIVGDIRYSKDGKTCVANVKLKPNRTYVIWFNDRNGKYQNFKDQAGQPAVPYLLAFKTGKQDA